jgi:cbb3-type cytochrome oxidase maturation protein
MSLVSVLIPVTMLLVGFGLWAFFWAVRTGQFDDLDIPAWEILVDDQSEAAAGPADPDDPA